MATCKDSRTSARQFEGACGRQIHRARVGIYSSPHKVVAEHGEAYENSLGRSRRLAASCLGLNALLFIQTTYAPFTKRCGPLVGNSGSVGCTSLKRAFLADPGFILKPDLNGLARRRRRQGFLHQLSEVFLKAISAARSFFGCTGRGCRRVMRS
jgi:hypothetical protein